MLSDSDKHEWNEVGNINFLVTFSTSGEIDGDIARCGREDNRNFWCDVVDIEAEERVELVRSISRKEDPARDANQI